MALSAQINVENVMFSYNVYYHFTVKEENLTDNPIVENYLLRLM